MLRLDADEEKKPPAERVRFAEERRLEYAHWLREVHVVQYVSRHGREIERVAARGCLVEAGRTAAAAQSAGPKSTAAATTAWTTAARPPPPPGPPGPPGHRQRRLQPRR